MSHKMKRMSHGERMNQLKGRTYKPEPRNISNLGVIWVTQAETAIRSNQSQGRFGRSLLIMHNTSADTWINTWINIWINTQTASIVHTHTRSVTQAESLGRSATDAQTDAFKQHTDASRWTAALFCRVYPPIKFSCPHLSHCCSMPSSPPASGMLHWSPLTVTAPLPVIVKFSAAQMKLRTQTLLDAPLDQRWTMPHSNTAAKPFHPVHVNLPDHSNAHIINSSFQESRPQSAASFSMITNSAISCLNMWAWQSRCRAVNTGELYWVQHRTSNAAWKHPRFWWPHSEKQSR